MPKQTTKPRSETSGRKKQNRRQSKNRKKPPGSELDEPIWAVIDLNGCRIIDVTYEEALQSTVPSPGTIITSIAASRNTVD